MPKFCCPICKHQVKEDLYIFNTSVSIKGAMKEYRYEHAICNGCGVIMVYPLPPENEIVDYYSNAFPFEYPLMDKRQFEAYKFIQKNIISQKKSIFDIGAGMGYFLSLFKKDGWDCSGIEPNRSLVNVVFDKYGIKLSHGGIEDFLNCGKAGTKFEVVTMSHLLEHLYSPHQVINQVRNMINENGFFFIEVPSLEKFSEHEVNSEIMAFNHFWHFTSETLSHLLKRSGFTPVAVETSCKENFPVIRSIFQKRPLRNLRSFKSQKIDNRKIKSAREYFLKYIKRRDIKKKRALEKIKNLFNENERITFYGAGGDLYDMMVSHPEIFNENNWLLVDTNPGKWDLTLYGKVICNPEILLEIDRPAICITSRLSTIQNSIINSIENLQLKQAVITKLFD